MLTQSVVQQEIIKGEWQLNLKTFFYTLYFCKAKNSILDYARSHHSFILRFSLFSPKIMVISKKKKKRSLL